MLRGTRRLTPLGSPDRSPLPLPLPQHQILHRLARVLVLVKDPINLAGDRHLDPHLPGALVEGPTDREISGMAYDSRRVTPGTLFVAVPGLGPAGRTLDAGDLHAFSVPFGRVEQVFHIGPAGQGREHLMSGDVLFNNGIGRTDLLGGDPSAMAQSLLRLMGAYEDGTLVYPGHGPVTTIGDERRSSRFLREALAEKYARDDIESLLAGARP